MIAGAHPFEQVAAGELACETDPDPAAGNRGFRHAFRHEVVKRAVEMGQRHIDRDPGDRQLGRHRRTGGSAAAGGGGLAAGAATRSRVPRWRGTSGCRPLLLPCHAPVLPDPLPPDG